MNGRRGGICRPTAFSPFRAVALPPDVLAGQPACSQAAHPAMTFILTDEDSRFLSRSPGGGDGKPT